MFTLANPVLLNKSEVKGVYITRTCYPVCTMYVAKPDGFVLIRCFVIEKVFEFTFYIDVEK